MRNTLMATQSKHYIDKIFTNRADDDSSPARARSHMKPQNPYRPVSSYKQPGRNQNIQGEHANSSWKIHLT